MLLGLVSFQLRYSFVSETTSLYCTPHDGVVRWEYSLYRAKNTTSTFDQEAANQV